MRNAVRYDYCVEAAIESLVPICSDIVVLDCKSEDGTLELLRTIEARHGGLVRVYGDVPWEQQSDHYLRLALLANAARELVRADWHFMIQADEVLHERSYDPIRRAQEHNFWGHETFRVRRLNLYGDLDHYVRLDSARKPCSDVPTRLGLQPVPAIGDAESLAESNGFDDRLVREVTLFHYGYVRRGDALIDKAMDMQSWFFGPGSTVDDRVVRMHREGTGFLPYEIIPPEELAPIPMDHPAAARRWVAERR